MLNLPYLNTICTQLFLHNPGNKAQNNKLNDRRIEHVLPAGLYHNNNKDGKYKIIIAAAHNLCMIGSDP